MYLNITTKYGEYPAIIYHVTNISTYVQSALAWIY
jgi:hypothetical protein